MTNNFWRKSLLSRRYALILTFSLLNSVTLLLAQEARKAESPAEAGERNETETTLIPLVNEVFKNAAVERRDISEAFANNFGMPTGPEDLWMYALEIKEGPIVKTIHIRPRASRRIDLIFIEQPESRENANYYHTLANGKLVRSTHVISAKAGRAGKVENVPNDRAQKGFEVELAFWLKWMEDSKRWHAAK